MGIRSQWQATTWLTLTLKKLIVLCLAHTLSHARHLTWSIEEIHSNLRWSSSPHIQQGEKAPHLGFEYKARDGGGVAAAASILALTYGLGWSQIFSSCLPPLPPCWHSAASSWHPSRPPHQPSYLWSIMALALFQCGARRTPALHPKTCSLPYVCLFHCGLIGILLPLVGICLHTNNCFPGSSKTVNKAQWNCGYL